METRLATPKKSKPKSDNKTYVAKGTYQRYAEPRYLSRRDEVNSYAPKMLALLLRLRSIDQESFARQMGLSISALRDRLGGKTSMSVGEVAAVAMLLEVPITVFIDRSMSMADVMDSARRPQ